MPSTAAATRSARRLTTARSSCCSRRWTDWRHGFREQRYLCGEVETEADWRLFPSLVRFDPCYYVGYKCNLRRLDEYPNLSNYLRELYQKPGIADVCDIAGMKRGVFSKAGPIGSNGIVPIGPAVDYSRPHDRDRLRRSA